jgi:hypothetical protein
MLYVTFSHNLLMCGCQLINPLNIYAFEKIVDDRLINRVTSIR